jgi:hypothetical protein
VPSEDPSFDEYVRKTKIVPELGRERKGSLEKRLPQAGLGNPKSLIERV